MTQNERHRESKSPFPRSVEKRTPTRLKIKKQTENKKHHTMKMRTVILAAALAGAPLSSCLAATIAIPGDANIFGSGFAIPPGGGSLPPSFSFASGSGLVLSFSSVIGSVSSGPITFGPDGEGSTTFATDMNSFQGISGVQADTSFLLFGVFLDADPPTGTPPVSLDFRASGLTPNFLILSPSIAQIFYVGDGRTGTGGAGTEQSFQVPVGATRLFLGIADGQCDGTRVFGSPGNYGDNAGSFTATFNVPESSSVALFSFGFAIFMLRRARTRNTNAR